MNTHRLSREIALTLSGSTFYGTSEAAREHQGDIIERYLTRAVSELRGEISKLTSALREIHDTAVTTASAETACEDIVQMVNTALAPATTKEPTHLEEREPTNGACRHCGAITGQHGHLGVDGWECHPCWDKRLAAAREAKKEPK